VFLLPIRRRSCAVCKHPLHSHIFAEVHNALHAVGRDMTSQLSKIRFKNRASLRVVGRLRADYDDERGEGMKTSLALLQSSEEVVRYAGSHAVPARLLA
jgi:hypothetical protein